MTAYGDPHQPETASTGDQPPSDVRGGGGLAEAEAALTALEGAAAAIRDLHRLELADDRPPAQRWEREIAGVHQALSAARDLMVAVGNSCPLYAVQAQWRGIKPANSADDSKPAMELMTAGSKILAAHDALHQPVMDLHFAQLQLAHLAFDHEQPSIWDDPARL